MRGATPRTSMSMTGPSRGGGVGSPARNSQSSKRIERESNFKVVVRVRPPLPRELSGEVPFVNVVAVNESEQMITISENVESVVDERGWALATPGPYSSHSFVFDHVYEQNASQKTVYETTARAVVDSALQGYNATIFAYGQTGTGKTFTMEGFNKEGSIEARGIIPRAIEQIFGHIQRHANPRMRFLVRASYLQIYNEAISDLLKPDRSNLSIREDKKRGVFVDGLSEWVVRSPAEIYGLMQRGGAVRATGETKMNEVSSRSHAVFIVIAEQSETVYVDEHGAEMTPEEFQKFMHGRGVRREQEMGKLEDHVRQSFKVGKLNLVDLAGSERVRLSGATGQRLEESKQINRSLSALGNVISALTDTRGRSHVPYRDSKLTRMLEDSLGGNCRTTMMAMISPALEAMVETLSTLKFANRAKNIRNEARVNEDLDQKSLLRKYERELKKLRAELEARSKNVVDKRRLLELDEQRRRAEADKMVAIRALEARSLEFMHEKEEKKKLEQRIAMLMGQMIRGPRGEGSPGAAHTSGGAVIAEIIGGAPEIQVMMKEQQEKLRQEYEGKLADLERERETIEEEKAQVDRYKQLLLKQRDIMIALTQRLVERDEQIMALQDELDAYDRHHKELEEKLDEKTALLIKFQRISLEVSANSPVKNEELSQALADSSAAGGAGGRGERPSSSSTAAATAAAANDGTGATEVDQEDEDQDGASAPGSASAYGFHGSSNGMSIAAASNNGSQDGSIKPGSDTWRQAESHALRCAEEALTLELEIHLSRLEQDPTLRHLRDPLSSLLRQVVSKVRQSGTTIGAGAGGEGAGGAGAAAVVEIQRLTGENSRLDARVRQLERLRDEEVAKARDGGGVAAQMASVSARCELLVREREAVQTIMEQKIKVLVQGIAQSTGAVLQASSGGGGGLYATGQSGVAVQALSKDVAALQRLVNASIAALRNAASNSAPAPVAGGLPQPTRHPPQPPSSY